MSTKKIRRKKSMKKSIFHSHTLWLIFAFILCLIVLITVYHFRPIPTAQANNEHFPIKGFDVSRHQGQITWKNIKTSQYQFVFIKATEGGDYQDPMFVENWKNAHQTKLIVGAYHYFRNCKSGEEQAKNYIATVPLNSNSLPPVIDLEFQWNCPLVTADQLQKEIQAMAMYLESYYGKRPILYTTPNYYKHYIVGYLSKYPIWFQDFKQKPSHTDPRPWLFWQYSQKGKISGIQGIVDFNLFRGTLTELQQLQRITPIEKKT